MVTAPFPYWHHFNSAPGADNAELVRASLYQLELLLRQQSAPSDTAAVIIEPVLGEGGYVPAPPAFLQGVRDICDKNGLLLIIDEVQSGFGRTGRMFNIEYSGVRPDLLLMAKVGPRLSLDCACVDLNSHRALQMGSRLVLLSVRRL